MVKEEGCKYSMCLNKMFFGYRKHLWFYGRLEFSGKFEKFTLEKERSPKTCVQQDRRSKAKRPGRSLKVRKKPLKPPILLNILMRALMGPAILRLTQMIHLMETRTPALMMRCLMMMETTIPMTWKEIVGLMKNPIRNKVLLKLDTLLLF
ncbi:hypothetical protein EROM_020270 [Encephalitozoon romaleae SJ-2008]|uniref:Uncharacterized protein n=1 Tax=Encephalitozoon romaleae (strain SJ-2008) TaxID=1178016 RepID=I7AQB1_ENCRO|nr:hypothetical protein EROM_020270 [Encephalitozoon romaleae SJ-2008]AFN82502.1 hypothetical protein EROM_020270 [Encephalitozoon romaleae SJ-2008]